MRSRILVPTALALALVAMTACSSDRIGRAPDDGATPVKTLRPTFTHTPLEPTATETATAMPATPTPEEPTAIPATATPEQAALTVTSQTVNVRSGPGTGYDVIGQLAQDQQRPVTGKNPDGNWWQIDYDGGAGWVSGDNVSLTGPELVLVAADIPPLPTARPRPTAAPRPTARPQPTAAPATLFAQAGAQFRNADNTDFDWLTFWGRLGRTSEAAPIGGYRLRVSAPTGTIEVPFNAVWERAYAGYQTSEFLYNAKAEVRRGAGAFRAVVIDGSGQEVSDPIGGTALDVTHDVILSWSRR